MHPYYVGVCVPLLGEEQMRILIYKNPREEAGGVARPLRAFIGDAPSLIHPSNYQANLAALIEDMCHDLGEGHYVAQILYDDGSGRLVAVEVTPVQDTHVEIGALV